MKTATRLAALAIALAAATPAFAQRPQIGIGIAIDPLDAAAVLPPIEVYLPITIAPRLRLEPSLGIWTNDAPAGGTDRSNITLGIGAFFLNPVAPQVDLYVGARLKLNFASFDSPTADDSDTDLVLAGAIGGEYYLVPKFSLGLEGQLGLYRRGDVSGDDSGFFTTGLAFLRVYF